VGEINPQVYAYLNSSILVISSEDANYYMAKLFTSAKGALVLVSFISNSALTIVKVP